MNLLGHDLTFWVALIGAAIIRVVTSPFHSWARSFIMIVTSVFTAWLLTDPVLAWLGLNPAVYKAAVGGILALTADGLVRWMLNVSNDPGKILDLWSKFRGGGAK
jgi:hypothetical protein